MPTTVTAPITSAAERSASFTYDTFQCILITPSFCHSPTQTPVSLGRLVGLRQRIALLQCDALFV